MKNIPYLEVYRQTREGKVLNDDLSNFPQCSNPDNLVNPFLQQMSAVPGYTDSTVELLMNFHRSESNGKLKTIQKQGEAGRSQRGCNY